MNTVHLENISTATALNINKIQNSRVHNHTISDLSTYKTFAMETGAEKYLQIGCKYSLSLIIQY